MSGLTVTDLTTRTLTHHCVEQECHCDWRLSIYGCTEETAMYYVYIVNIALSGLVVAVGMCTCIIFHTTSISYGASS